MTARSSGVSLIASALSLAMGACSHQADQTAATQWYFDGTRYSEATESQAGSSYESSTSGDAINVEEDSGQDRWSERTYVYRGGRDPKTGIAYKQM